MKKAYFILMIMFCFHLYANGTQASPTQINATSPKLLEVVLTLPFEALIINHDGILVNYEGNLLLVNSLERNGEEWIVRAAGFCPNGHRIVCRCGGCGVSSCGYSCSCYSDDYKKIS